MDDKRKWSRDKKHKYVYQATNAEERFERIFEVQYWEGGGEETVSGWGSTAYDTENIRSTLPSIIQRFAVTSIFDAPCGDFNWMKLVLPQLSVDYIGGDIVKPMIEENQRRYGKPGRRFIHFDIASCRFPASDLWLCRDCLFHLSFEDAFKALRLFAESNIKYLLTSNHMVPEGFKNEDIFSGGFRLIDLFSAPYSLPRDALYRVDDPKADKACKEMVLWTREQVAGSLGL